MKRFHSFSAVEQLAEYLRDEIQAGTLVGMLPGVHKLAKDLGVSPRSVVAAVAQLEHEGLVASQGPRRRSQILWQEKRVTTALRVAILVYEATDRSLPYIVELGHRLREAGQIPIYTGKTLLDLGRDVKRVAQYVEQSNADVWIIFGGTREILEWFAKHHVPAFALFGRRRKIPIAGVGPDKTDAVRMAVRRLVGFGHKRIIMIVREERRKPLPGGLEQTFLDELTAHHIVTGSYNLPDWEETPVGFRRCLDSLFGVTPPTAMIIDGALFFAVAQQHLARRGIFPPEQISLICCDPDPSFAWFLPRVAHIDWDSNPVVRRIVDWVGNIAHGKDDRRQSVVKAKFIDGGTIGPAKV